MVLAAEGTLQEKEKNFPRNSLLTIELSNAEIRT